MRVSVVGTGYVGLVAGACFADVGNHVTCVDIDESKIRRLKNGEIPIYEPGLGEIVQRNMKAGRLEFTTDLKQAVANSLVILLAVGTPQGADGSADLSALLSVVEQIGTFMDGYRIIVTKSTVPVGTQKRISEILKQKTDHPFDAVSNPEFMKEGAAIDDFTKPDRVVLGTTNPAVVEILKQLYGPYMRKRERTLIMDPASAELTKYASNALLAVKVSFMNEIANLCERYGADVEQVRGGVGSDSRIGEAFLFPGVGYGGSCFPKDVSALVSMGKKVDYLPLITQAAQDTNQRQRRLFAQRVIDFCAGKPLTLAVWGLAFKARTDDVREAPALTALRMFREKGVTVRAHDPEAMPNAQRELNDNGISYFDDCYEPLKGADGLVIFTDWQEFRTPDFDRMKSLLRQPVIFDGRNLYDPAYMKKIGFAYHSIGRPTR